MRVSSLLFFLCLIPGIAQAWWNEDWPYRVRVNVSSGDTTFSQATMNDGTLLLRLHTGNFADFFYLNQDISDLRFIAADDTTPLKFHVEKFDLVNQLMFVWVKLPQLPMPDKMNYIYMYYSNPNAVSGEDRAGSFDVNRVAAFHFEGQNNIVIDSSAYTQKAALVNVERQSASLIGSGLAFDGKGYIEVTAAPSLQYLAGKGFAFSTWIKPQGMQQQARLFDHKSDEGRLVLGIEQSGLFAQWTAADGSETRTPATAPLTPDSWQHVAMNLDAQRLAVFVNGVELASVNVTVPNLTGTEVFIGGNKEAQGFIGEMDEVEMASVSRQPQWFALQTQSQGQQSTMLSLSEGEQLGSSGSDTAYFTVILKSVTLDGWVVIAICAIMAAISWLVMFAKSMMLNRMKKDNLAFVEDFRSIDNNNPTELDQAANEEEYGNDSPFLNAMFGKHDHYQSSPLYHLYHQGVRELKKRVGVALGADANNVLSAQSVSAIRAVLDASMVRESQKINDKMVLLTIAIAGGPFLGLLGTVVGVMITFAAIAASGDVNINSIAPGISAALMATVAGLAVAIPALFGYNYLSVRIKDMTSDMQVFIDEFITRIAEYHS